MDREIIVSVGRRRNSIHWKNERLSWSKLAERLKAVTKTMETIAEYQSMDKDAKAQLKDIGGFVGGELSGERRTAKNMKGRDLITLDLDNIPKGDLIKVLSRVKRLGSEYVIYSTRSHTEENPRLRIVLPLDRTASPNEYEPIARRIAEAIGLEYCDPTTFEASRLMYWPSCSVDAPFFYARNEADEPFIKADEWLAKYENWQNAVSWPQVPNEKAKRKALINTKQADPEEKEGIVGAFCRIYDIYRAIDKFIPDVYIETDYPDRLTYAGGSTTAGAVVYENGKFLYSHHSTDPCSEQLVNAFDLVRIHKFGEMDAGADPMTDMLDLPSYKAMAKLAKEDEEVAHEIFKNRVAAKAQDIFKAIPMPPIQPVQQKEEQKVKTADWLTEAGLARDLKTGEIRKTRDNVIRIMQHDPILKGKLIYDEFAGRTLANGELPWDSCAKRRIWTDADDAGVEWYLEYYFNLTGRDKVEDALKLVAKLNKINEVKDYLQALEWDGVPRLDTAISDYLGAVNDAYVRTVSRKSFTAAVARVMDPGCKYDCAPVFIGTQGLGKSTFLKIMSRSWFSDSVYTFDGKDAAELLRGVWIIELSEMTGYTKSETNVIKQFLSKQEDIYREAYGRRTETFSRQCVFFGTCNHYEFLKDITGNRRFWPIDVGEQPPIKSIWIDLPKEVDQLWAEAMARYVAGEPLYIEDPEMSKIAQEMQEKHRETNAKEGLIRHFLEIPIPTDYASMNLTDRRAFFTGTTFERPTEPRKKVCALEVWCECFGCDPARIKRVDAVEINQIINDTPGWKRVPNPFRFGYCGRQRGFRREEVVDESANKEK